MMINKISLVVLIGCWAATSVLAQHPVFGVYRPQIVDNISPEIDGELTIRPDSRVGRKAWIFNFVKEGPVLAMLDVDNPDGNRIYDIPAQIINGRPYPVGSLVFNADRKSIILSLGKGERELSFMGEKIGGRSVDAVTLPTPISPKRPLEKKTSDTVAHTDPVAVPSMPADTTNESWNGTVPEPGKTMRLNNVYFALSEATLLPDSYPELNRLAKFMQQRPTLRIRLEGHTDIIGEAGKNLTLSLERVEAVKNYLLGKGIDPARMQTKGYGDTRPLITKGTTEERKANRRVEFAVLSN